MVLVGEISVKPAEHFVPTHSEEGLMVGLAKSISVSVPLDASATHLVSNLSLSRPFSSVNRLIQASLESLVFC